MFPSDAKRLSNALGDTLSRLKLKLDSASTLATSRSMSAKAALVRSLVSPSRAASSLSKWSFSSKAFRNWLSTCRATLRCSTWYSSTRLFWMRRNCRKLSVSSCRRHSAKYPLSSLILRS